MTKHAHELPVSLVVVTYQREEVLCETIDHLLRQSPLPVEILVIDQTPAHDPLVASQLQQWAENGDIEWIRLERPSITHAMNVGLQRARGKAVLYADDDVIPEAGLIEAHWRALNVDQVAVVAGRVIQPWQEGVDFSSDKRDHLAATHSYTADEFIGCNFSVWRDFALELGGFDENFVRVAYRYEAEFSARTRNAGGVIRFEPEAVLHHLHDGRGGTRSFGNHLRTARPDHSVGAYYFALRSGKMFSGVGSRLIGSVRTRHHFRQPWWIPFTLTGELLGLLWACWLWIRGPALIVTRVGDEDRKSHS